MRPELVQWMELLSEGAILPGSPRQSRAWKSVHAPRFTKYTAGPSCIYTFQNPSKRPTSCQSRYHLGSFFLCRSRTNYRISLSANCACGPSGLNPGGKMRGIISCTCWKSRIQYLSTTFTGASLGPRGETESRISVVFRSAGETRECSWDETLIIQWLNALNFRSQHLQ